jgi:hypothetical protein
MITSSWEEGDKVGAGREDRNEMYRLDPVEVGKDKASGSHKC